MKVVPEVTCIGELMVDFVSIKAGVSLAESSGFFKFAGGAPANVAVGLARLGTKAAFVGKVGNDSFGKFLGGQLRREGVDVRGLCYDKRYKTRLAFVSLTKSGERDFEFWEQRPADEQLENSDVDVDRIAASKIVHISSFSLLSNPARSTVLRAAIDVGQRGCAVSFDPNLRLSLWKSPRVARMQAQQVVKLSTILRLNEEEARFLTGKQKLQTAAEKLLSTGPKIVVVTLGGDGCFFQTANHSGFVKGFTVKEVDTTGCGDGFLAGFLHGIARTTKKLKELSAKDLQSICQYANAVGALTATRRGGISALPNSHETGKFLKKRTRIR
ncbi:MAG: PfkB family carbohydrate kinase [Bacteroidota bacterium]